MQIIKLFQVVNMAVVYLLGDWTRDNVYKIGVTRGKVSERIKKLQTGNSGEIYLVDCFETSYPFLMERNLHMKFCGKNISGEWFELTPEEIINFKKYCIELEKMFESLKDNPFFNKKLKNSI